MIQHKALASIMQWYQEEYKISQDDRGCQIVGPGFDPVKEINQSSNNPQGNLQFKNT